MDGLALAEQVGVAPPRRLGRLQPLQSRRARRCGEPAGRKCPPPPVVPQIGTLQGGAIPLALAGISAGQLLPLIPLRIRR